MSGLVVLVNVNENQSAL